MLDIGWSEMAMIALLALIVIGPKDLPKLMRSIGQWTRKARSVARDFQSGLDDMMRENELDEARKTVERTSNFNVGQELEREVDPEGSIRKEASDLDRDARSDSSSGGATTVSRETPTAPGNSVNAGQSNSGGSKSGSSSGTKSGSKSAASKSGGSKASTAKSSGSAKTGSSKSSGTKPAGSKSSSGKSSGAKTSSGKSTGSKSSGGKSTASKSGGKSTASKGTGRKTSSTASS